VSELPRIDVRELPSKGITYPEGWKVYYRPYSVGDILALSQSKLQLGDIYKKIAAGIETVGFPVENLLWNDFILLSLFRKCTSLPIEYFIADGEKCEKCGEPIDHRFHLEDLDFEEPKFNKNVIIIKVKDVEFRMRPWTLGMEIEKLETLDETKGVLDYLKLMVDGDKELFDKRMRECTEEAWKPLYQLWSYLFLTVWDLKAPCKKCGTENKISVRAGGRRLTPFCRSAGPAEVWIDLG